MCNGDKNRKLKFEVYDWDKVILILFLFPSFNNKKKKVGDHDLIGECHCTVAELKVGKTMDLINEKAKKKKGSKYKNSGELMVIKFDCIPKFEFIEFVQGMLEINMMIGIDYTGSNGNPTSTSSLHYIGDKSDNQYIKAMEAIIPIVSFYDQDKKYPT